MAKEEKKSKTEEGKDGKKKAAKKHLHSIHTEQAEDGTYVHHHTYKGKKEDHMTEPTRMNAATSADAEEAGQHVAEQFAQNGGAGEDNPEEEAAEEPAGDQPAGPAQGV